MTRMDVQAELLEVVLTLGSCCSLTHLLHGRHQLGDQDCDDGDDDERLNECEHRVTPSNRPDFRHFLFEMPPNASFDKRQMSQTHRSGVALKALSCSIYGSIW